MNALAALRNDLQTYFCGQITQVKNALVSKIERAVYSLIVWRIDAAFQDNPKIQSEIKKIDAAIKALERQQDEIVALQELLGDSLPPFFAQGICQEELRFIGGGARSVQARQDALRSSLIQALKTHRVSEVALMSGIRKQRHIVAMKSEFMRLADLLNQNSQRPASDALIAMPPVDTRGWRGPSCPILRFPESAFAFRYPEDTGENRRHAVVTIQSKLIYKKDSEWGQTLHYVEGVYLQRPYRNFSLADLRETFEDLAERLQLVKRSRECLLPIEERPPSTRSSVQEALKRWGSDFHLASHAFSAADWEALSQDNFVAPKPQEIEGLLHRFFERLQVHLQDSTLHPFQVAGFIHWALTRIRPYKDGNGSVIRLYMNIWLMQNGFQPLVIKDNSEYLRIFIDPNYIQSFGNYLNKNTKCKVQNA